MTFVPCLLGGAVGIAAGRGGSALVRVLLDWPTELSIGAIIAASVGIVFGFTRPGKARASTRTALRYE